MAAEPAAKLNLCDRKVDSTLLAAAHKHLSYYRQDTAISFKISLRPLIVMHNE